MYQTPKIDEWKMNLFQEKSFEKKIIRHIYKNQIRVYIIERQNY